ncbi:hypothetical protein Btru_001772 [Bulinus truncatus]|nr:hypothetical protein Btru_001772 [Bulinus truncatus]
MHNYAGTTAQQDTRFSDKRKKLMKTMKFAEGLERKVDMTKVNVDSLKPWIAQRINDLLGMEDDVVVEFVYNQLEERHPDAKKMQINLTCAQENVTGIPNQFLEQKKNEIKQRQEEQERLKEVVKKKEEQIKEQLARERREVEKQEKEEAKLLTEERAGKEMIKKKLNLSLIKEMHHLLMLIGRLKLSRSLNLMVKMMILYLVFQKLKEKKKFPVKILQIKKKIGLKKDPQRDVIVGTEKGGDVLILGTEDTEDDLGQQIEADPQFHALGLVFWTSLPTRKKPRSSSEESSSSSEEDGKPRAQADVSSLKSGVQKRRNYRKHEDESGKDSSSSSSDDSSDDERSTQQVNGRGREEDVDLHLLDIPGQAQTYTITIKATKSVAYLTHQIGDSPLRLPKEINIHYLHLPKKKCFLLLRLLCQLKRKESPQKSGSEDESSSESEREPSPPPKGKPTKSKVSRSPPPKKVPSKKDSSSSDSDSEEESDDSGPIDCHLEVQQRKQIKSFLTQTEKDTENTAAIREKIERIIRTSPRKVKKRSPSPKEGSGRKASSTPSPSEVVKIFPLCIQAEAKSCHPDNPLLKKSSKQSSVSPKARSKPSRRPPSASSSGSSSSSEEEVKEKTDVKKETRLASRINRSVSPPSQRNVPPSKRLDSFLDLEEENLVMRRGASVSEDSDDGSKKKKKKKEKKHKKHKKHRKHKHRKESSERQEKGEELERLEKKHYSQ